MNRLQGKVAIITGTARGQGRAAAVKFADEGAKVVGCDLRTDLNEETKKIVESAGGTFISVAPCDVPDRKEAQKLVNTTLEHFGHIDILYNNASAQHLGGIENYTDEDWEFTMRNDLAIVFPLTQIVWKEMVKQNKGGSIIITASGGAFFVSGSSPSIGHSTAKGGIQGFIRALASESAKYQIRVNGIMPGVTDTEILRDAWGDKAEEWIANMKKNMPMGRLGQPEDIANYALFLASDESSYMTNTIVPVDGGYTSILP